MLKEPLTHYLYIPFLLGVCQAAVLTIHILKIKKNEWQNCVCTHFLDMCNGDVSVSVAYHQSCAHTC